MTARRVHLRDTRLFVNAGMRFPACHASAPMLDCDKSRLATTTDRAAVSCKRCLRLIRNEAAK